MTTLVIKSNAATTSDVLIPDMGILIPSGGGNETFTDEANIGSARSSTDLINLCTDDAYGANSSTLILNDGVSDIPQDLVEESLSPATRIPQIVTVAKSGGDYTSVGAAIAEITDASASKPYVIRVAPGVYTESPFTMKSYVDIVADGSFFTSTLETNDNNANFITGAYSSKLKGLSIKGPTGTGYAAVNYTTPSGLPFQAENCLVSGYYGFCVNGSGSGPLKAVAQFLSCAALDSIEEFIRVTGYASVGALYCSVAGAPGLVTKGYVVDGSNAKLSCDLSSFAISGSTIGFSADNGAILKMIACTIKEGNIGLYVGPNGSNTNVDAVGCTINRDTITAIDVDSSTAEATFSGEADKNTFSIISGAEFSAVISDTTSGEEGQVVLGELWLGTLSEAVPLRDYGLSRYSTGLVSGGSLSRNTGLAINVAAGSAFINTGTGVSKHEWSAVTGLALTANATNYIFVNSSGVVTASTSNPGHGATNIVWIGLAVTDATDVVELSKHTVPLPQPAVRSHQFAKEAVGPIAVSGLTTTEHAAPSLQLAVGPGTYWQANERYQVSGTAPISFVYWYQDGAGGWNYVKSQTAIDPSNYDDGTGTLAALPAGKWKRDLLFLAAHDSVEEYHIVYAQTYYDSQAAAESGDNPAAPSTLTDFSIQVAAPVVQQGATDIASIVDQRPFLGQLAPGTTAVTFHGSLSGLSNDDHTQYLLASGARSLIGNLDVGGNAITNVGNVDGVDVSAHSIRHENGGADEISVAGLSGLLADPQNPTAHASSHQHGGADEVATATPAANAIPKAAADARLRRAWLTPDPLARPDEWSSFRRGECQAEGSISKNDVQYARAWLEAGTVITSMRIHNTSGANGSRSVNLGIYDQADPSSATGTPRNKVAEAGSTAPAAAGDYTVALTTSYTVSTSGYYWLAAIQDANQLSWRAVSAGPGGFWPLYFEASTGTTLPATAGTLTQPYSGAVFVAAVE